MMKKTGSLFFVFGHLPGSLPLGLPRFRDFFGVVPMCRLEFGIEVNRVGVTVVLNVGQQIANGQIVLRRGRGRGVGARG